MEPFLCGGMSSGDTKERAYSGGQSHGECTLKVTRVVAVSTEDPPACAARAPRRARNRSELPETVHMSADVGTTKTTGSGRTVPAEKVTADANAA